MSNNASFYPVFHRGPAEGIWLTRGAMDLKRMKTTALYRSVTMTGFVDIYLGQKAAPQWLEVGQP
jgi:hypothetical protein